MWFTAGAASAGVVLSAAWLLLSPADVVMTSAVSDDFNKAFAIHGPLESEWTRVHQLGGLDIWSDAANTTLAITEDGRAVQMLSSDEVCCTCDS